MRFTKSMFAAIVVSASFWSVSGQVNVEMVDVKVNNVATGSNAIAFTSAATVNVTLQVKLTTTNGNSNNIFGNLFLYTKEATAATAIQHGFNAVTFTVQYPPFVPETTYTSVLSMSTTLTKSQFYSSGGVFYAQYVNNSNNSFNSVTKPITGGTKTAPIGGGDPSGINNIACCNQIVRYGDKSGLIVANTLSPNISFDVKWIKTGGTMYGVANMAEDVINTLDLDYVFESGTYRRYIGNDYPYNAGTPVTITVVPNAISGYQISSNATQISGDKYEINAGIPLVFDGLAASVNINLYEDPNHTPGHTDWYDFVNSYQWQYRSALGSGDNKWHDLEGENDDDLVGFTGSPVTPNNFFVRRISRYMEITRVSNTIEIVRRNTSQTNAICCAQELASLPSGGFALPAQLTGSTPDFDYSYGPGNFQLTNYAVAYQWQKKSRSIPWANIPGATLRDYLPPAQTSHVTYRRICTITYSGVANGVAFNSNYTIYSNEVVVRVEDGTRNKMNQGTDVKVTLYPNPASGIVNIETNDELSDLKLRLVNMLGTIQKVENFYSVSKNLVTIDVSHLPSGIYFFLIDTPSGSHQQKFVKI